MEINAKSPEGEELNLNTNNFSDAHAEIIEKSDELKALCKQYNVNFGLIVEAGFKGEIISAFHVEGEPIRINTFWGHFDGALRYFTDNVVCLGFLDKEEQKENEE